MKGVSPIVATMLLLAITVIAAVGLWYYSQSVMDSAQTTSSTPQSIGIVSCDLSGNIVLKNLDDKAVSVRFRVVYASNYSFVGYFNASIGATKGMLSSADIYGNATPLRESNYAAIADGFTTANFHCPE